MLILKSIFCMLMLTLVGCAGKPPMPTTLANADISGSTGLITGTITRNPLQPAYTAYGLYIRNIETEENHKIYTDLTGDFVDFHNLPTNNDSRVTGSSFALLLPEGKYEIYNFNLYELEPSGASTTYFAESDFSVPFQVSGGEKFYLGEFRLIANTFMFEWFGVEKEVLSGGTWYIYDFFERDIDMMKKKFPDVDWQKTKKEIPMPTANLELLIRSGG
ncbi:hypothetical protein [Psychromonas sp. MME2]|uniref:hypothetical protein n=1 Tax=unclassified Psychromonas TaxID=2614957 RepID=UPI00339BAAB4